MQKHTFLVEIGTEELPPKILRYLSEVLLDKIKKKLNKANIKFGEVHWFATPRRIAVKIEEIKKEQSNKLIEKLGPSISEAFDSDIKPTIAAKKWAKSCGITVNQAERIVTKNGEWLVYRFISKKKKIEILLCEILKSSLNELIIPKIMFWNNKNIKFIRPVRTIIMLLDNNIIIGEIFGIKSNRVSKGHRFMGLQEIIINHANEYPKILEKHGYVIADYLKRKNIIIENIKKSAKKLNGIADVNNDLLEEVTSLVEWPVVLTACFNKKFLKIPKEALANIMRYYQKYFSVYDFKGNILPYFIFVANINSKNAKIIISGNEKVINARLSDAEFFLNNDRKKKLGDNLNKLKSIIFKKKLGSLYDKSHRIKHLSKWIANKIGADSNKTARAGLLSKCDLLTNMVCEFPDMQGIIGMYYARYDGESEEIALAQKEQYQPKYALDSIPTTLISCAVSIADKIDTLIGLFGINHPPKSNSDPFALRRLAKGVLRIIIEKKLLLDLNPLMEKSKNLYKTKLTNNLVINDVIDFIFSRLLNWYQEKGYRIDTIQSVFSLRITKLYDVDSRIRAIHYFHTLKESKMLIISNKRVSNILKKAININFSNNFIIDILQEPAEIKLANCLISVRKIIKPMIKGLHYKDAIKELIVFSKPIDNFFKSVMIMTDNKKICINRLILLFQIRQLFLQIADISFLFNIIVYIFLIIKS